jgi:hypothetical protein
VKLKTQKLAVFVTCLGIAAAFPVLGSADQGGVPNANSHKPCKKTHKPKKKQHPDNRGKTKGKKCGWNGGTTTAAASPTVPTGTETGTTTSTLSTVSSS